MNLPGSLMELNQKMFNYELDITLYISYRR